MKLRHYLSDLQDNVPQYYFFVKPWLKLGIRKLSAKKSIFNLLCCLFLLLCLLCVLVTAVDISQEVAAVCDLVEEETLWA